MDNNSQYLQMFFDESAEYLQQLNENVLLLEENPQDEEIINSVFRAAHSVKGMSATMGFTRLTDLTHKMENILSKVRNKEMQINEKLIDVLFAGLDYIKDLVDDIKNNGEELTDINNYLIRLENVLLNKDNDDDIQENTNSKDKFADVSDEEEIIEDFEKILGLSKEEESDLLDSMNVEDLLYNIKVVLDDNCLLKNVRGYMVLKKAQELGFLVKSSPSQSEIEDEDFDLSIYIIIVSTLDKETIISEFQDIIDVKEVKIHTRDVKNKVDIATESVNKANDFTSSDDISNNDHVTPTNDISNNNDLRSDDDNFEENISKVNSEIKESAKTDKEQIIESDINKKTEKKKAKKLSNVQVSPTVRVDIKKLDNLMNMVGELLINKTRLAGLNVDNDVYQDIILQLDRVTTDLHHIVMQIRMVPIGGIFNRFPRMVRDLSKELNKDIDLLIEGADTELDRSIIDELADPLMHIIRNAIDHGIEIPELREKNGKAKKGNILLNAYQKGSEIVIEVEDDGAGLDKEKIIEKAISRGIISYDDANEMDEKDIYNLVFHPGFSTSEKVTDISGRGVGMDVVKRVVESLDGQIFIESEKGIGTRFIISLPLTLAITQALMVKINNEVYAIPLNTISESHLISPKEILQVRGQDVMVLRDSTIPLVECARKLNLDIEYGTYKEKEEVPVVIINSGEKQIGLIVDELLNQQEIVIKSLGNYLLNIKNISGATIVGDGEVALILDVRNIA
ncbi:chemotaxis protein CheA [Natronospora cellulosivora (SeqCode)]